MPDFVTRSNKLPHLLNCLCPMGDGGACCPHVSPSPAHFACQRCHLHTFVQIPHHSNLPTPFTLFKSNQEATHQEHFVPEYGALSKG